MKDDPVISHIVAKIVNEVNPLRIYLFGSRARGEATVDSDVDLLVIADMAGDRRDRSRRIRHLFSGRKFSLDVFVLGPQEFERQKRLISSIGYVAEKEGRVVYDRA